MPQISVLMPVYNGRKYLGQAIESVLNQTENDFELVIVDDGSNDGSLELIQSFKDSRIKLISTAHFGLIDALNRGLEECQGEYIARMDADDVAWPGRLRAQKQFLDKNKKVAMCGTWASVIDEEGRVVDEYVYPPLESKKIRKYIWFHNPFIHSTIMIRRAVVEVVGGYRSLWKYVEDYELWIRIAFRYPTANLGEKLLAYRIHRAQITKKKKFSMHCRGGLLRVWALGCWITSKKGGRQE